MAECENCYANLTGYTYSPAKVKAEREAKIDSLLQRALLAESRGMTGLAERFFEHAHRLAEGISHD
jgi:hypothetical protein